MPVPARLTCVPTNSSDDMKRLRDACGLRPTSVEPLHILVPHAEQRRNVPGVCCHVWDNRLPPGSVARASSGVLVATPEFLYLLAARRSSFLSLVEFGYELCALFTVRNDEGRYQELERSITTAEKIRAYLETCEGLPGVRKARAAIPWVLDRSRSPRETKFAISMTLPRFRGGQAVRNVSLNTQIPLTALERKAAGKSHYELDLCVPGPNDAHPYVGAEYYGKEEHAGELRGLRDIRRESILASKGISIHGVTKEQATNVMELERLAKVLTVSQGERWRKPTAAQEKAMRELIRSLYFHGSNDMRRP